MCTVDNIGERNSGGESRDIDCSGGSGGGSSGGGGGARSSGVNGCGNDWRFALATRSSLLLTALASAMLGSKSRVFLLLSVIAPPTVAATTTALTARDFAGVAAALSCYKAVRVAF
jgi:hypothetical protein